MPPLKKFDSSSLVDLKPVHLAGMPRRVGRLREDDVFHIATRGGLHLMVATDPRLKKARVLGAGPNRALARHLADRAEPSATFDSLEKSEAVAPVLLRHYLPLCARATAGLRAVDLGPIWPWGQQ